jgi:hypothetical protein
MLAYAGFKKANNYPPTWVGLIILIKHYINELG